MAASERTFLRRVINGLGFPSRAALAKYLNVKDHELAALEKLERGRLSDSTVDPMWHDLAALVDRRIGELMAVREELNRKLAADRQNQLLRHAAIRGQR